MHYSTKSVGTSQKNIFSVAGPLFLNINKNIKKADVSSALVDGILEAGTIVNSSMATATTTLTGGTKGVFTLTISTALIDGESVTIDGVTYTAKTTPTTGSTTEFAVGTSSTTQATALKALLSSDKFTIATSTNTITFTQKVAGVGAKPELTVTSSTGSAAISQTTAPANPSATSDAFGIIVNDIDFNNAIDDEEIASVCIFGFVNPKVVKFNESSVGKAAELTAMKMIKEVEV